jgi:hypothetical protein
MSNGTTQDLQLIRGAFLGAINDAIAKHGNRPYDMTVQVYSQNTYVPVARNCFAFMFTNVGDTAATVNGMVVFPSATPLTALGDSRTIAAHELDLYTGNITLSFRAVVGPAPGVEIVQLYYV